MTNTKWKIETDKITLLPNRGAIIFGLIVTFLVIAAFVAGRHELANSTRSLINYLLVFGSAAIFSLAPVRNKVIFDILNKQLQVKLYGIFTTKTVPFSDIAVIDTVTENGGVYSFHVFRKSDRHGKSIRISCPYSKKNDPNALALVNEVFPIIESHLAGEAFPGQTNMNSNPLSRSTPLSGTSAEQTRRPVITSFEYYTVEDGVYTPKVSRVGLIILAAAMFGLSFYFMFRTEPTGAVATYFPMILAIVLIFMASKKVLLNTKNRTILQTSLAGLIKKEYSFDDFENFEILRKKANFVNVGTEVGLILALKNTDDVAVVGLASFNKSSKVERFLDETSTILGV